MALFHMKSLFRVTVSVDYFTDLVNVLYWPECASAVVRNAEGTDVN